MNFKLLFVIALLVFTVGCTKAQRQAGLSGSILYASKDVVVQAIVEWIDGDEITINALNEPYQYIKGRAETYENLDQAAQVIPIILEREALWGVFKTKAATIRDVLYEHEARTEKPMPFLVAQFINEGTLFVASMDKAIDEKNTNVRVAYVSKNFGRYTLILGGLPQLAGLIPAKATQGAPWVLMPGEFVI